MQNMNGYNVNLDPIGSGNAAGGGDPIGLGMPDAQAPIGGGGVTPQPDPTQTAQNMDVQTTGIPPMPVLPPPTVSQKLIALGQGMIAGDRQGIGLGGAMGAGMNAVTNQQLDYNALQMKQRAQQLADYQTMGAIADRHNTELAMQRKLAAGVAFKQAYPQLATMYDADPTTAVKMVSDYYTNNGMSPVGAAGGGAAPAGDAAPAGTAPASGEPTQGSAAPAQAPASYQAYRDQLDAPTKQYLNSLPPEVQSKALGYASGNVSLPSPRAPTYPAALAMAQKLNPNFNEKTVQEQEKVVDDFNTGEAAQKARALNTGIYHLAGLSPLIDKLGNAQGHTGATVYNYLGNLAHESAGDTNITEFQNHADKLSDELSKVYGGASGGTDSMRKSQGASFDSSLGPDQLHANVSDTVDLLTGVLKGLQNQYNSGMVPLDKRKPLLTPESAAALKKLGVDPDSIAGATKPSLADPNKVDAITQAATAPVRAASPAAPPVTGQRGTNNAGIAAAPKTAADYAALPSGSLYIDPTTGATKRKK